MKKTIYLNHIEDSSGLLVSPEHKIYSKKESKSSIMSRVDRTLTTDWRLNLGSLDQIPEFNFNASAKKGTSLSCMSFLASASNSLNDSLGTISTSLSNSDNFSLNCSELSPEYFNTSNLFFFNSSIECSGENRDRLINFDLDISSFTGFSLKKETNMLESTTNLMVYQPSFLYLFHMPSLILSPISSAFASNSISDSIFLSIFSFQDNCFTLDSMDVLTNPDQLTSGNFFICSLTSSGTDNVIDTILSSNYLNYVRNQRFLSMLRNAKHFRHVKKRKNVKVFKSFDLNEELLVSPNYRVYVDIKEKDNEKAQSSFLFLRSDQSKESLTLNSLNFVSILNNSTNTPPNNISVIGGEPIMPNHFNIITNTANAINPQAIIPSILSNNSLFIYVLLDLFINNPIITPEIIPIDILNPILNFNNKLSTAVTTTTTPAPPKIVVYSFDNIDKNYLNSYIKLSHFGDSTEVDINITTPSTEPPGNKNSTILFSAYYVSMTGISGG